MLPFFNVDGHHVYYVTEGRSKMKKILIAYESRNGNTEQMAEYIAEGVRMNG